MDSRYLEANGIDLHLLDHGGEGPVVLLLHGLTANAHFFDTLVGEGLGDGLRPIAVDLRGRGRSGKPETGYEMEDHAADILGVLDQLGLEKAILAGHSFGGLLSLYLAANSPERVERAAILDVPATVDERVLEQIKPSLQRLDMVHESWDAYLELVKAMPYYQGWWDPKAEDFYREDVETDDEGHVRSRCRPEHIGQAIEGTLHVDWDEVISRITLPLLLVATTEPFGPPGSPPILAPEDARGLVDKMVHGHLAMVPGNHITAFLGSNAAGLARVLRTFAIGGDHD